MADLDYAVGNNGLLANMSAGWEIRKGDFEYRDHDKSSD